MKQTNQEERTWHIMPYETIVQVQEFDEEFRITTSEYKETRYRVVDILTGEILDDAQGYGFKTKQKAFLCWNWKTNQKEHYKK